MDEETREILDSFVSEGYERLDDSESQLSRLEAGNETAVLNSVFRLFHSVKGSAGYLGLDHVKGLTHEAETLLDVFLKEKVPITTEALDVVYETIDILRKLISTIEKELSDESGKDVAAAQAKKIAETIAKLRAGPAGDKPNADEGRNADDGRNTDGNAIVENALVEKKMIQRYLGECADLVDGAERKALALSAGKDPREDINDIFRAVHTIKGNAGFFGHAALETSCQEFEGLLEKARSVSGAPAETLVSSILSHVDRIRSIIATVTVVSAETNAERAYEETRKTDDGSGEAVMRRDPVSEGSIRTETAPAYKPLGEILVDMGVVESQAVSDALAEQERPLGEILVQKGVVDREHVTSALRLQKESAPLAEQEPQHEIVRREIRVDTAKLDKLFELVGELITAESMLVNCPDLEGINLDRFNKSFASLSKISREIQETTMMVRMIPLDGLFQKMTRLVRDLSRKFDRPIQLQVSGQDTEMDKNVIEQVADPLVHILRNAVDHGIEKKEDRVAAGKSESGTIRLNAKYEGSEIWISVSDDGGGLDRERILAKAAEKGLVAGDASGLPDDEVWAFLFEPGFSTSETVSEVSGRGVGLDVVKRNIERIRGRVTVRTAPGEGTEFTLAIPITMAIIDGITVRVGSSRYSIPLSDIIEFVKVAPKQITRTDVDRETINVRSEFIPLIRLHDVFNVKTAVTEPTEGIIIVVQNNGMKACLLIDEVVGNQQIVIKSLSEYLGKVEGISGCSILGDGNVSFIVDTGRLLSLRLE